MLCFFFVSQLNKTFPCYILASFGHIWRWHMKHDDCNSKYGATSSDIAIFRHRQFQKTIVKLLLPAKSQQASQIRNHPTHSSSGPFVLYIKSKPPRLHVKLHMNCIYSSLNLKIFYLGLSTKLGTRNPLVIKMI